MCEFSYCVYQKIWKKILESYEIYGKKLMILRKNSKNYLEKNLKILNFFYTIEIFEIFNKLLYFSKFSINYHTFQNFQ